MLKIFIADDEQIVIDSIKFIIEKNNVKADVIGFAKSGREAVEKIIDLKPDIVFMDIRMPGINGIEAIKQIKDQYKDILFVIISAYEYFNYAKDAIELGVIDYLLKPLNKSKIIEVITSASDIISEKKVRIAKELELREKLNKILPYIEGQFLYSQLFNESDLNELSFYEDIFHMKLNYGYIILGNIISDEKLNNENNLLISIEKQKFFDYFKEVFKDLTKCIVSAPLINSIFAYIPVEDNINSYEIKNISIDLAKKFLDYIGEELKIQYKLGIGRPYYIENFINSFREAEIATKITNKDIIMHFDDAAIVLETSRDLYPAGKENIFLDKIISGNLEQAIIIFNDIYEWMILNYGKDIDKLKSRILEIITNIKRAIPYYSEKIYYLESEYYLDLLKTTDVEEIKLKFISNLRGLFENINIIKGKEINNITGKVIKYITENYNKNITMVDAAKEINMSYHYFSKFFKEQTGENFVDFITNFRILKAKEMLKDESQTIKEIAYNIGYSDPNYFSKLFKKSTGLSPTEYRLLNISKEEVL